MLTIVVVQAPGSAHESLTRMPAGRRRVSKQHTIAPFGLSQHHEAMVVSAVQKHPRYRLNATVDVVTASAQIEQLTAENISLGGIFLRTSTPPPMGSPVRLRLRPGTTTNTNDNEPIGLAGTVVHVIDAALAAEKALSMGVGVQFDPLAERTEAVLRRFVDELAVRAKRDAVMLSPAHFSANDIVTVQSARVVLQMLWSQGLEHGFLFAAGDCPTAGRALRVVIGPIELRGEVLQQQRDAEGLLRGGTVQLIDLEGQRRLAITRFLDGSAPVLFVREASDEVAAALVAARRLFLGIDENDPFAGLSLPDDVSEGELQRRVAHLRRVFTMVPDDASPPQRIRLRSAATALDKLEPVLFERIAARRRRQAQEQLQERVPSRVFPRGEAVAPDDVSDLMKRASEHERANELVAARKALETALQLAPDDVVVQQRLASVVAACDLARAVELVQKASVIIQVNARRQPGTKASVIPSGRWSLRRMP